jgi:hypothetical protein
MKSLRQLLGLLVLSLWLPGCSESTKIELHEPGQYKGKADPLRLASATPQHQEQLRERLMMVQTDR